MANPSLLQIHSLAETDGPDGIYVVRCIGGVARPGQTFTVDGSAESAGLPEIRYTLTGIERYRRPVDLLDPPHSAKIRLSGPSAALLPARCVLRSVADAQAARAASPR